MKAITGNILNAEFHDTHRAPTCPQAPRELQLLPGSSSTWPADFNTQLAGWPASAAKVRRHARTRAIPGRGPDHRSRGDGEPAAGGATTGTTVSTQLGRDCYVSMASSAYSAHPEARM